MIDKNKLLKGSSLILEGLGIEKEENFTETPRRMADVFAELCNGLSEEKDKILKENLSKVFPTDYKGMIIQEPIRAYSLCSHHLLPVTYDIVFGYVPNKVTLGFSKSIRVIELLSAKPVSQEDLTQEIVETFMGVLNPKGCMVIVKGSHMCMTIRACKTNAVNITSALRGVFKDDEKTRNEFLTLAGFK